MQKILVITALLFIVAFSNLLANPIIFDPKISDQLGESDFSGLDSDNTVYSYRIGGEIKLDLRGRILNLSPFGYVFSYQVSALGPVLNKPEVVHLLDIISNDHNFIFENQPCLCCYSEPEVAFLFVSPKRESTAVLLSERCLQLYLLTNTKAAKLYPDSCAVELWEFLETIFPSSATIKDESRELSPLAPNRTPIWYTEIPDSVNGPSVYDMRDGEILTIAVGINRHVGLKTYDYILSFAEKRPFLKPGKELSKEFRESSRYYLTQEELGELQEFIKNCRWVNVSPKRGHHSLELEWSDGSKFLHFERFNWVESKEEGYATFSLLGSVWEFWHGESSEK